LGSGVYAQGVDVVVGSSVTVGRSVALGCSVKVAVSPITGLAVAVLVAGCCVKVIVGENVLSEAVFVMDGGKGFSLEYGLKKMIPK
jgi:hypothetical protein